MRKSIIISVLCICCASLAAQDLNLGFKHWYITDLNLRLTKRTSIAVGQLSSFDVEGYRNSFRMYKLNVSRKLNDTWKGTLGYSYNIITRSNGTTLPYSRIHVEMAHRLELSKHLRMRTSLRLEQYFPQLSKFQARAVITNKWWYYNKKWPLRLSPFFKSQLFYYHGGKDVSYWIPEEDLEPGDISPIRQAPNGWHRYRFATGVRARLSPQLNMSLFYMLQREFNTGLAPFRELNVPNRDGTKINRRFNNYSLIGISLIYTLKLY